MAIALDAEDAATFDNRGRAFARQALDADAITDPQFYLELAPNASGRNQVEQLINTLK